MLWGFGAAQDGSSPCDPRRYDYDSVVCVCTAEYCDFPGVIAAPDDPELYTAVTSSRDGLRFETQQLPFARRAGSIVCLRVYLVFSRFSGDFPLHFLIREVRQLARAKFKQ